MSAILSRMQRVVLVAAGMWMMLPGQNVGAAQKQNTAQAAAAPSGADAGNAARGKQLFVKDGCYECHGYVAQGGSSFGPRLAPDPPPWQAIAAYIRKPAGSMPPYVSKLVPDQDVQDIYAYLKSIPGPVDLKNIPTFTK